MDSHKTTTKELGLFSYDYIIPSWIGDEKEKLTVLFKSVSSSNTREAAEARAKAVMQATRLYLIDKTRFERIGSLEDKKDKIDSIRKLKDCLEMSLKTLNVLFNNESFPTYLYNRIQEILGKAKADEILSVPGGNHANLKIFDDINIILKSCDFILLEPDSKPPKSGPKTGSRRNWALSQLLSSLIEICEEAQGKKLIKTLPRPKDDLLSQVWDIIWQPIGKTSLSDATVNEILGQRQQKKPCY